MGKIETITVTLLFVCISIYASSIEIGGIYNNSQDWSADTIHVTQDLYISLWDTSEIKVNSGTVFIFYGTGMRMIGKGLNFIGAPNDSIHFTAADTTEGWGGVTAQRFDLTMEYCTFERTNSRYTISYYGANKSTLELRHCRLSNNKSSAALKVRSTGDKQVIIENCEVLGNENGFWVDVADCVIRNSHFRENNGTSVYFQGFVYDSCKISMSDNTFENNSGENTVTIETARAVILNNRFVRNVSVSPDQDMGGAAVFFSNTHRSEIRKNVFLYNRMVLDTGSIGPDWGGGAIYINGTLNREQIISNNLFAGNRAVNGGAVHLNNVWNCTFANNTFTQNAASNAPAVYIESTDRGVIHFVNDIFYQNIQSSTEELSSPVNSYSNYSYVSPNATFTGCLFDLPDTAYISNAYVKCIYGDPLFEDPENADYSFQALSPCIDAGDTAGISQTLSGTDINDKPRINGDAVDIGAYEFRKSTGTQKSHSYASFKRKQKSYRTEIGQKTGATHKRYYLPNGTMISGRALKQNRPFGVYIVEDIVELRGMLEKQ